MLGILAIIQELYRNQFKGIYLENQNFFLDIFLDI